MIFRCGSGPVGTDPRFVELLAAKDADGEIAVGTPAFASPRVPPQPMIAQTRAVLERYAESGGSHREVVLDGTGHAPFLERQDDVLAALLEMVSRGL